MAVTVQDGKSPARVQSYPVRKLLSLESANEFALGTTLPGPIVPAAIECNQLALKSTGLNSQSAPVMLLFFPTYTTSIAV